MQPVLAGEVVPDWAGIGGLVTTVLGAVALLVQRVRLSRIERRRGEQQVEQDDQDFGLKQLRAIIRDLRADLRAQAAAHDGMLRGIRQELQEVREAERRCYATSERQAEVIKFLQMQLGELKARLAEEGITVRSAEHPPIPPAGG